jgi:D-alanyl-D-alanine carboxypeptidase
LILGEPTLKTMFRRWTALTALTAAVVVPAAAALPASADSGSIRFDPAALRKAIAIQPTDQLAGIIAQVRVGPQVWRGQTADTVTHKKIPANAYFRIGSISKTFEATIVLQLVAEHRIELGQTVQHYLPGLLPKRYKPITVRNLLDMTSGLPQIGEGSPNETVDYTIKHRFDYQSLDQIIQGTLRPKGRPWPKPHFIPGAEQSYNSLNYRIAAELIQKRTGHSFATELNRRILKPLNLSQTFSADRYRALPSPYLHAYLPRSNGTFADVSEQGGDATSMISTPGDIERFFTGLFSGELLRPAQFKEMQTVPNVKYADASDCVIGPDRGKACYGLGLERVTFGDGTVMWGKTGHDLGYASAMFATLDLRTSMMYAVAQTQTDGGMPATALRIAQAVGLPLT